MREYLRVGLGSGADSLIRNVAYFFMIVRIVNTIGSTEIGGYYVAIQILWSFMLVPVLAFADSAKALVANVSGDIERVKSLWRASMLVVTGMMVVWIALTPAFPSFAGALTDDEDTVRWAVTAFGILFVPYVLFSFNTVIDSIFYGIGENEVFGLPGHPHQRHGLSCRVSALCVGSLDPDFRGSHGPVLSWHTGGLNSDRVLPHQGAVL